MLVIRPSHQAGNRAGLVNTSCTTVLRGWQFDRKGKPDMNNKCVLCPFTEGKQSECIPECALNIEGKCAFVHIATNLANGADMLDGAVFNLADVVASSTRRKNQDN